jgi:hypothetical protein
MTKKTFHNVQSNSTRMRLECGWWLIPKEGRAIHERHRYVEVDIGKIRLRNAYGHKINRIERNVLRK